MVTSATARGIDLRSLASAPMLLRSSPPSFSCTLICPSTRTRFCVSTATVDEEGEEGEEATTRMQVDGEEAEDDSTPAAAPMDVAPSKASFVRTSLRTMRTGPLLKK